MRNPIAYATHCVLLHWLEKQFVVATEYRYSLQPLIGYRRSIPCIRRSWYRQHKRSDHLNSPPA